ncbi:MAG: hypothetical protein EOM68_26270 [Spirochaetia bacterium]|nr:hypothetical protein [Spirochaetia bacterium]
MKRRRLLLVFLLCSTCFALQATPNFTAIYQPERYLEFKNGTDPYTNSQFVALLGTMTVEITSPVSMRQPSFVQMNSSAEFYFRGMFDWNPNNINTTHTMQNTQFYLDTVTTVRNPQEHVYKIRQSRGDGIALLTTVDNWYNVSFFETKIYLRANPSADKYLPGSRYDLVSGTIGTFNFAVSDESGNINHMKVYVSVNRQVIVDNNPVSEPIPVVGTSGPTTTLPSVPYVDGDHPNPDRVLYLLQILDVRSFNPSDAFNPHRARVATAKITLQNAKPDEAYDVYISFDSEVTPGQFRLSLDGDPSQYGFSYTLFFQDEPVNPDEQESWLGLTLQGPNEAYIDARIIEESKAENAPAGTYSDTIRVSITPFDTI